MVVCVEYLMVAAAAQIALALSALSPPATVGVFVDFDHAAPRALIDSMQREVKSLLEPAGVATAWRRLRESQGAEKFDNVLVVRFTGVCGPSPRKVRDELDSAGGEITLASTKVRSGHVLPWTVVRCDSIRQGFAARPASPWGRLLGRILAHEILHRIADTTEHGHRGLFKATHAWDELLEGKLRFAAPDLGRVTRAIRLR